MFAPPGKVVATETAEKSPPMTTIVALVASLAVAEMSAATASAPTSQQQARIAERVEAPARASLPIVAVELALTSSIHHSIVENVEILVRRMQRAAKATVLIFKPNLNIAVPVGKRAKAESCAAKGLALQPTLVLSFSCTSPIANPRLYVCFLPPKERWWVLKSRER